MNNFDDILVVEELCEDGLTYLDSFLSLLLIYC